MEERESRGGSRGVGWRGCALLLLLGACAGSERAQVSESLEELLLRVPAAGLEAIAAAERNLESARADLERARAVARGVQELQAKVQAELGAPAAELERAREQHAALRAGGDPAALEAARAQLWEAGAERRAAERELAYHAELLAFAQRRVELREGRVALAEAGLELARVAAAAGVAPSAAQSLGLSESEQRVRHLSQAQTGAESDLRAARRKLEVWHAHLLESGGRALPTPDSLRDQPAATRE